MGEWKIYIGKFKLEILNLQFTFSNEIGGYDIPLFQYPITSNFYLPFSEFYPLTSYFILPLSTLPSMKFKNHLKFSARFLFHENLQYIL